jgi:hypothetical protein
VHEIASSLGDSLLAMTAGTRKSGLSAFLLFAGRFGPSGVPQQTQSKEHHMIINIADRRELFVDGFLIDSMRDASLQLQHPERREVVTLDAPWEDCVAFPMSILRWGDTWRLYYRAGILDWQREEDTNVTAMAESRDGITFTRPDLGLVEFQGSQHNNILQLGGFPQVPPPFVDARPTCPPAQVFKGFCARWEKAYAMASADGLRWSLLQQEPLALAGQFDTENTAFWDSRIGAYRCYTRGWFDLNRRRMIMGKEFEGSRAVRAIQHAASPDFLHWSAPEPLEYADGDVETHLYTNAILPCPGAEHLYVGFPNRFLPDLRCDPTHADPGANDALFMASRDGVRWTRYQEAWVRPGLDPLNWTERNNYPIWGIAETSPTEWSMYISEHYRHQGLPTRMRRLAIRPWGFVSVHAGFAGGEMVTKPFTFAGARLLLNASTAAAGWLRVEVQEASGRVIPGLGSSDMAAWFGDALDAPIAWQAGGSLGRLAGRPIRLRFVLKDADLFSVRFGESE